MKLASFFKTLNQKINKYDKFASNPFEAPQSLILIWVEKDSSDWSNSDEKFNL